MDYLKMDKSELIYRLIAFCEAAGMFCEQKQVVLFCGVFKALLARDLDRAQRLMLAFREIPEEAILPMTLLGRVWGNVVDHHGQTYLLSLGCLRLIVDPRKNGKPGHNTKFGGGKDYMFSLYAGKYAEGYCSCFDDRFVGVRDHESDYMDAQKALDKVVDVFEERFERKIEQLRPASDYQLIASVFGLQPVDLQRWDTDDFRRQVKKEKDLRAFASRLEEARRLEPLPYWWWYICHYRAARRHEWQMWLRKR